MPNAIRISDDEVAAVRDCQSGHAEAFRLIVDEYGQMMQGTAYLMLGNRGDAEDATQDAFVSAWRGLDRFDSSRPLRPWLMRILVNEVRQRRRRRLLRLVPLGEPSMSLPSLEAGPERSLEQAERREELRAAIGTLPPDTARIVILRYFAELSLGEIAQATGAPEGTVKSRLHRALRKLRDELEPAQGRSEA
jgi:RNA polymerase sigma-70 factor (ECF subfamily)